MADKKSIILHTDSAEQWNLLTDEQAGQLIKALLVYSQTGDQIETDDGMLKMAFSFISAQLDRDREKYDEKCAKNKRIADEREKKKIAEREKREQEETNVHERARTCTNATYTDTDTDTDTESDTDTDTDTETDININTCADKPRTRTRFTPPSVEEVAEYCRERGNRVNPQQFVDFYASKGWKVGNAPMKDWKAAIRSTWERQERQQSRAAPAKPYAKQPVTSSIDMDIVDRLMNPYGSGGSA